MSSLTEGAVVGRVAGLWRYPVKSMAGQSLHEVDVGWHGFAGDRRWAFVRDGVAQSGFPWLTLRQNDAMRLYEAAFENPSDPDASVTTVATPSGVSYDVTDPALAAELHPAGARVVRQDRGVFDAFPLSLLSVQSVERLEASVGQDLDLRRFRPNIVLSARDGSPFLEDALVGAVVRIGGMRMRIDKRDGRCVVITIDPETGSRSPDVLRTVVSEREGCFGVYGSVVEPGRVAVGDEIVVE